MRVLPWLLSVVLVFGQSRGRGEEQPPPADSSVENARAAAMFAAAEATRYQIRRNTENGDVLKRVEQPLLRWSNPTRTEVHGTTFAWTRNGCPEAIASIYQYFEKQQINVELVSLSEHSLIADRNGRTRWLAEAGVKFAAIPGADAPADSAGQRRQQMRSLARGFLGELGDASDETQLTVLRLMDRPLHTYRATDDSGREGAIFALATANDPEILLLIESVPTAAAREWRYALARMNHARLRVSHADEVVWEVPQAAPPWDKIRGPEGTYIILEWKTTQQAELD